MNRELVLAFPILKMLDQVTCSKRQQVEEHKILSRNQRIKIKIDFWFGNIDVSSEDLSQLKETFSSKYNVYFWR